MAMMPLTANEIKDYLNEDKFHELRIGMVTFFRSSNIGYNDELLLISVGFRDRKNFSRCDVNGYEISGTNTIGRYFTNTESIGVCADNMSRLVNDFRQLLYKRKLFHYCSSTFLLCDMVLFHEYMHAYQHLVEHKSLTHADRLFEEEANRRAVVILTYIYENNEDLIKVLVDFYKDKSEFGFGDRFSIDELLAHRNDVKYLANMFS